MKMPFLRHAGLMAAVLMGGAASGPAQAQLLPGGLPGAGLGLPSPPSMSAPSSVAVPPSVGRASSAPIETGGIGAVSATPILPRLPDVSRTIPPSATQPVLDASSDLARRANDALGLTGEVADDLAVVAEGATSYREQARTLLRGHSDLLEPDDQGRPTVRGEVLGVGISRAATDRAVAEGFSVRSREAMEGLGLSAIAFGAPRGMSAVEAVRRLRALDPAGRYDFNHVYVASGGGAGVAAAASPSGSPPSGKGLRIGLVDGAALASHPALRATPLVQQPFGPGGARVTAHGTAVASLLAGDGPGFRGAAPGATVYVADVYGPTAAGGSALAVARALGWLAKMGTPVINISLVGPPNTLLQAGVAALVSRGHLVVAAVGNDGPAAGPLYPAAYPGVVAVTGVDAGRRALPEAGRGGYVAFAAPGAAMMAAGLDGGLVAVRGTSFAAPLVAGRLARGLRGADPAAASRAVATLSAEAADLGRPGRDPVFGRGLVAADLAVRPGTLTARR